MHTCSSAEFLLKNFKSYKKTIFFFSLENTWNCDENNNCCTGCGWQEEFYNCADIAIGNVPILPPPNWVR